MPSIAHNSSPRRTRRLLPAGVTAAHRPDTGLTELVDLPCGATREDKCPACAARARRLRMQQIREGWHLPDEPLPPPGRPSSDQVGLVILRAHLEFDRAQTLLRPMPAEQRERELVDIDTAITELEEENRRVRAARRRYRRRDR